MPTLANWLGFDSKSASHSDSRRSPADRRLANRFLQYWEDLRGSNDFPLISDLNLSDLGAFVPHTFNLDLSAGNEDPKFRFIGEKLIQDCGGDVTNQRVSQLLPQSRLARVIQQSDEVIAERKPCIISDEFINAQGHKVLFRAVMMPFSNTGERVDFIIGAINSKTVEAQQGTDRPLRIPGSVEPQSNLTHPSEVLPNPANRGIARQGNKVSEMVAEVSAAMSEEPPTDGGLEQRETQTGLTIPRTGGSAPRGRIIVIGSEKGGTGKSTIAMHLITALLYDGNRVGCIDLDSPQSSLSRYIENRQTVNRQHGLALPLPEQVGSSDPAQGTGLLEEGLIRLAGFCDFVVVDTPGSDTAISRMAHSWANIVITPINDSFVDLDTLAVLDPDGKQILRRGHYAEMVAQGRKQKIARTGEGFDWIVLRNRLSNLEARNKNRMADALADLSGYLDFRNCAGLSERVIYRELFLKGLTLLDLPLDGAGVNLSMAHVTARQELRLLMKALGIPNVAGVLKTSMASA